MLGIQLACSKWLVPFLTIILLMPCQLLNVLYLTLYRLRDFLSQASGPPSDILHRVQINFIVRRHLKIKSINSFYSQMLEFLHIDLNRLSCNPHPAYLIPIRVSIELPCSMTGKYSSEVWKLVHHGMINLVLPQIGFVCCNHFTNG